MDLSKLEINLFMDLFFVENQSHLLRVGHKIHKSQKILTCESKSRK
jgi:hypothetical protein